MSTRSVVLVNTRMRYAEREAEVQPTARMYRHCDGYPDGNGLDIVKALATADMEDFQAVTNRNWATLFLKHFLAQNVSVEFETPAGDGATYWGDLSYLYVVTGDYANFGGLHDDSAAITDVTIQVYDVPFDCGFDPMYSNRDQVCRKLYEGGWRGYPKWLRKYSKTANTGGRCVFDDDYSSGNWACMGVSEDVWRSLQMLSN